MECARVMRCGKRQQGGDAEMGRRREMKNSYSPSLSDCERGSLELVGCARGGVQKGGGV